MTVKGSKQYQPIVVAYRPLQRLLWVALGTLAVTLLALACFWFGYEDALRDQRLALEEWEHLQSRVAQQDEQIQLLSAQLSNSQVGGNVDKQSMEVLRKEIMELNQTIAELQESNHFYRSLMEPATDGKGLTIGSLKLLPQSTPRLYHYQIVIQQLAREPRTLSGQARVTLIGVQGGQARQFALHELSSQVTAADIPLKFRFYQSIEGDLTLPEGFELQRIDVVADKQGGNSPVQRSFDWQKASQTF